MDKTKSGYQSTYSFKAKRNSRKRKKKLTRNLLLLLSAFIIVAVLFAKGSIGRFFMIFAVEVLLAAGLVAVSTYLKSESKTGSKRGPQNIVQSHERSNIKPVQNIKRHNEDRYRVTPKKKSNFDWVLDKDRETAAAKVAEPEAEVVNVEKEVKEERKFVPYRSPFEPINPVNKVVEPVKEEIETETAAEELDRDDPDFIGVQENESGEGIAEVGNYDFDDEEENESSISITFDDEATEHPDDEDFVPSMDGGLDVEPDSCEEDDSSHMQISEDSNADYIEVEENHEEIVEQQDTIVEDIDEKPKVIRLIKRAKGTVVVQGGNKQPESPAPRHKSEIVLPSTGLLKKNETENKELLNMSESEYKAQKLIETLASFGVGAKVVNVSKGPAVTRYELQPNIGVKVSKIVNLADDIALNLAATAVRIEAPIPGKAAVGIEIPNKEVTSVLLRDVIESEEFTRHPSKLAFAVGKDISGNTVVADIAKMPHLLIAGATGSGKSVCINTLIASILYKADPSEVKLLMIDPKVVELNIYNGIPHLLIPVVTDPKKAAGALNWAMQEMLNRYKLFADNCVRDLKGYNNFIRNKGEGEELPQIVIIIDELADLMMAAPNDVEDYICRLAQMARAAGMHIVIATQRPSVDVITGVIKANIPSRISFAVTSQVDSRTILDMSGAEKLLGRGDMLFNPAGEPKPIRVQGAFISDKEVEAIVDHLKSNCAVQYDEEILKKIEKTTEPAQVESDGDDELLQQAIEMVIDCGQASTSLVQRKFKVGYARAARIVDQMEAWGVVSSFDGSKPRKILVTRQEWDELNA